MMWQDIVITPDTPIIKAIEIIDKVSLQIALVVNKKGQLLGTVTDGDIRRAILKHISMYDPVSKVMNTSPHTIYRNQSREVAISIMRTTRVRQIPVIDDDSRLVDMEIADELLVPPQLDNWVILMAGGRGQRLQPLTEACPKPLLEVGGKPLLETILESFIQQGFNHFYISVHYKAEMIMEYFGDGFRWGAEIKYLHEKEGLGTAGALGLLPAKPAEPLVVMNGDILTKVNYRQLIDFHKKNIAEVTVCIKEQYSQIPYGVVTVDKNRLIKIQEKPVSHYFINAGLYVLNPDVLDYIPYATHYDMTDLFRSLVKKKKEITVFPIREYWIDIGRFDDYQKANNEFTEVFGC
ncbi:MAG: nucleotidyltransferase family protein [Syntrophomonadaceae bacterium]|nr:nucleotidyltransferase family protein [Syntrophomonadaceae bacterium]